MVIIVVTFIVTVMDIVAVLIVVMVIVAVVGAVVFVLPGCLFFGGASIFCFYFLVVSFSGECLIGGVFGFKSCLLNY